MPGRPEHQPTTTDTLTVHVETLPDGTVLASLTGALDHHTVDRLTDAVQPALGTTAPTVWLDLAGLTFLDSSGLTRLLHLYRAARQTGGHLALIAPGARVRRMLDITGVGQVIPHHPDRPAPQTDRPTPGSP
ncbi:STAS domain-containing protein [Streptomyces sp. NPDC048193]|uniref:STAS domain-containing protein n=1 Tax=unclassified Streptomyces TaxID=2593676 RepID=UPI003427E4F3